MNLPKTTRASTVGAGVAVIAVIAVTAALLAYSGVTPLRFGGGAALPPLTVTGVAVNNSSAKIDFNPIAGAKDYRVYDITNPHDVKYAGQVHLDAGANRKFTMNGTVPVYPYTTTNGTGPEFLDVAATEIEWNSLGDNQAHTLVVQALDALGPAPQHNLYTFATDSALYPPGGMLGSNKGPTPDGNVSTNGQGPYTNNPNVIAQSEPFLAQANPALVPLPSRVDATQLFQDTFNSPATDPITAAGPIDPIAGTMNQTMGIGTSHPWDLNYYNVDTINTMSFIAGSHFMDMIFDGGTPGTNNPVHTQYGVLAMHPRATFDFSSGQVLHLTMEVDGHQDARRWMELWLTPANDPAQAFVHNSVQNTSGNWLGFQLSVGGCVLNLSVGNTAHPQAGALGQAPIWCQDTWGPYIDWGGNGPGFDNRNRIDLFVSGAHWASFLDGQLVQQGALSPGLPFTAANVYYTHYAYHTALDQQELKQSNCYPQNSYWYNDPTNGSTACGVTYPGGFGYPGSDERHWDNMGAEVLPSSVAGADWSSLASLIHMPAFVAPVAPGGTPVPTATVAPPTNTPTATPTTMAVTATPTPVICAPAPTATPTP